MDYLVIQLFAAFLGSLGFSLLFRIAKHHLFLASLGGALTWLVYLVIRFFGSGVFLSCFFAALFAGSYSEWMAHLRKAPNTLFTVPCIVPLIPGSGLYYTMSYTVAGETLRAAQIGKDTVLTALAISAGISSVLTVRYIIQKRKDRTK